MLAQQGYVYYLGCLRETQARNGNAKQSAFVNCVNGEVAVSVVCILHQKLQF